MLGTLHAASFHRAVCPTLSRSPFFALGHTRTHDPRAIRLFTFTSAVAGRISMRIHLTSAPLYIRALIRGHTALSCDISLPRMSMCFCKLCTFPALALLRACLPAFLHFIHQPRIHYSVQRGEVCRARSLGLGGGRAWAWAWAWTRRGGGMRRCVYHLFLLRFYLFCILGHPWVVNMYYSFC